MKSNHLTQKKVLINVNCREIKQHYFHGKFKNCLLERSMLEKVFSFDLLVKLKKNVLKNWHNCWMIEQITLHCKTAFKVTMVTFSYRNLRKVLQPKTTDWLLWGEWKTARRRNNSEEFKEAHPAKRCQSSIKIVTDFMRKRNVDSAIQLLSNYIENRMLHLKDEPMKLLKQQHPQIFWISLWCSSTLWTWNDIFCEIRINKWITNKSCFKDKRRIGPF